MLVIIAFQTTKLPLEPKNSQPIFSISSPTTEFPPEPELPHELDNTQYEVDRDNALCGNKQRLDTFKEAVEYCDKYECEGIYDKNCDGRTIYICGELRKPKNQTFAQNGCTYRKKGSHEK